MLEVCVRSEAGGLERNSERDGQMSETMIKNRNLPNPHLFEPFFRTRACHHPSSYYYLIFKAMGKPA